MKVLFACNQNENRSKTAERIFQGKWETRSAGLYNAHPINKKDLEWADAVIVMEDAQREEIGKRFPEQYLKKRILSLNIPDVYTRDQPELVRLIKSKMRQLL